MLGWRHVSYDMVLTMGYAQKAFELTSDSDVRKIVEGALRLTYSHSISLFCLGAFRV